MENENPVARERFEQKWAAERHLPLERSPRFPDCYDDFSTNSRWIAFHDGYAQADADLRPPASSLCTTEPVTVRTRFETQWAIEKFLPPVVRSRRDPDLYIDPLTSVLWVAYVAGYAEALAVRIATPAGPQSTDTCA